MGMELVRDIGLKSLAVGEEHNLTLVIDAGWSVGWANLASKEILDEAGIRSVRSDPRQGNDTDRDLKPITITLSHLSLRRLDSRDMRLGRHTLFNATIEVTDAPVQVESVMPMAAYKNLVVNSSRLAHSDPPITPTR